MKLCLGCGPHPIHPQHIEVMQDLADWTLVDLYVKAPGIENWDATKLDEVEDGSVDHIYTSHTLEHFPHTETRRILKLWARKLRKGGRLTINVPDLVWVCYRILRHDQGGLLDGYYNAFEGEHGLQSVLYGSQSHDGEFHKAGFTERSLIAHLEAAGLDAVEITRTVDGHDMGVLIAEGFKP